MERTEEKKVTYSTKLETVDVKPSVIYKHGEKYPFYMFVKGLEGKDVTLKDIIILRDFFDEIVKEHQPVVNKKDGVKIGDLNIVGGEKEGNENLTVAGGEISER